MTTRRLIAFCILAAAIAVPAVARAGSFNHIGRYLGWGWSNGYHAQNVAVPPPQTNWRGLPYGQNPHRHYGPYQGPRPSAPQGPYSPQGRAMMNSDGPVSPSHVVDPQIVPMTK